MHKNLSSHLYLWLITFAAYSNSFTVPFIYDDIEGIVRNPALTSLWPFWNAFFSPPDTTPAGRPLVSFSLAINHAISGLNPWSYHLFNLIAHALAGSFLFELLKECVKVRPLGTEEPTSQRIPWFATALWLLHPLQTKAVTYVVQRTEVMSGLFLLAALVWGIKALEDSMRREFNFKSLLCIACCWLAVLSKESGALAPLLLLLWDRCHGADTSRKAWMQRPRFYCAAFGSWLLLALLLAGNPRGGSSGFHLTEVPALKYWLTQPGVILHYLRLSFWPSDLTFLYDWPLATRLLDFLPQALLLILSVVFLLGIVTPSIQFWILWFILGLAPSACIPLLEIASEQRMYLPLAAISFLVTGFLFHATKAVGKYQTWIAAMLLVFLPATLTFLRNQTFHTAVGLWEDTVNKQPHGVRGWHNLGNAYVQAVERGKGIAAFEMAQRLRPDYIDNLFNLGLLRLVMKDTQKGSRDLQKVFALNPYYLKPRLALADFFIRIRDYRQAAFVIQEGLRLMPDNLELQRRWQMLPKKSPPSPLNPAP